MTTCWFGPRIGSCNPCDFVPPICENGVRLGCAYTISGFEDCTLDTGGEGGTFSDLNGTYSFTETDILGDPITNLWVPFIYKQATGTPKIWYFRLQVPLACGVSDLTSRGTLTASFWDEAQEFSVGNDTFSQFYEGDDGESNSDDITGCYDISLGWLSQNITIEQNFIT